MTQWPVLSQVDAMWPVGTNGTKTDATVISQDALIDSSGARSDVTKTSDEIQAHLTISRKFTFTL